MYRMLIISIALMLLFFGGAEAREKTPVRVDLHDEFITNQVPVPGKAAKDTFYLMGGPGDLAGKFEDASGQPDWNGWERVDETIAEGLWSADLFGGEWTGDNPGSSNYVAWCGQHFEYGCAWGDDGYGNGWLVFLDQRVTVPDPDEETTVVMDFRLSHDLEPDNDMGFFGLADDNVGGTVNPDPSLGYQYYMDTQQNLDEHLEFIVPVSEYVGPDNNQIHLRFAVWTDNAWSDEDCMWPTNGAMQIDDITVLLNGNLASEDHFAEDDLGNWEMVLPQVAVGNFSGIWSDIPDSDPCVSNTSPQVAFFDHPDSNFGTGGTPCNYFCYGGPLGNYIVNNNGGLAGPDFSLHNSILSPVLDWPDDLEVDGATLLFDLYQHQPWQSYDWDGVCYGWGVRSESVSSDPIQYMDWEGDDYLYFGGPNYLRFTRDVSDLLVWNRTRVQIKLMCVDGFDSVGFDGVTGTPAPYFDNVALIAYHLIGPKMTTYKRELAQDAFPAIGAMDLENPASLSCRFDAAIGDDDTPATARDAIRATIVAVRDGTQLQGMPRMYFQLQANPIFDSYRTNLPPGDYVEGTPAMANGVPIDDQWDFDLPDEGMLFPGDVLHYYLWAQDDGSAEESVATLPADITGFGDFSDPQAYNQVFVMRCLPTLRDFGEGTQPPVLWWNDGGISSNLDRWYEAFAHLELVPGEDFDIYCTQGASSALGNGLGGRATVEVITGYESIIYSSGDLERGTLGDGSTGEGDDPADDIGLLEAWLDSGNRNLCLSGDNLASDLNGRPAASDFLLNQVGVEVAGFPGEVSSVHPLIGNQQRPLVRPLAGASMFANAGEWIADGGCPILNTFDAINPQNVETVAEFADTNGVFGSYSYAAATRWSSSTVEVVFFPYDLGFVEPPNGANKAGPIVSHILHDVLVTFDHVDLLGPPESVDDLRAEQLTSGNPVGEMTGVQLTWPLLGPNASARIYRHGFGNYPEYDDAPGSGAVPDIPADPDAAEAAGWTLVATTTGNSHVDDPPERDFWYYVLYVYEYDSYSYSPVSNLSAGSLNYHLGDVAGGGAAGEGDNLVSTADISALGASYGAAVGEPDYNPFLDVGPTVGFDPKGRPLTDNLVAFDDLIVMALNYGDVDKTGRAPSPLAAGGIQLEVPEIQPGSRTLEVLLTMRGDGSVQGLSVPVRWNPAVLELTEIQEGELLAEQGGQHVLFTRDSGTVDAALLGSRSGGICGEGVLAKFQFQVLGPGEPGFTLGNITARTAQNMGADLAGEVVSWVPRVTQLQQVAPNPFNPQTTVVYDVARTGAVKLRIYGVDGRLIRTLVSEAQDAGRYSRIWDGTDDQGRSAASGVYLLRLEASGTVQGRKMMLVR